jgi:hypothetical protein
VQSVADPGCVPGSAGGARTRPEPLAKTDPANQATAPSEADLPSLDRCEHPTFTNPRHLPSPFLPASCEHLLGDRNLDEPVESADRIADGRASHRPTGSASHLLIERMPPHPRTCRSNSLDGPPLPSVAGAPAAADRGAEVEAIRGGGRAVHHHEPVLLRGRDLTGVGAH